MITINTKKGTYSFDEKNHRIFKNNVFLPRTIAEPVYNNSGKDGEPSFTGIFLVDSGEILTLSGNLKKIIDINSIK